jgi:hypothetical protein
MLYLLTREEGEVSLYTDLLPPLRILYRTLCSVFLQ